MLGDAMNSKTQKRFGNICARISLNIPSRCGWSWDGVYETALVAFDRTELDLIYLPITQEFDEQWDIDTIDRFHPQFTTYFKRVFGIVPGQKIFTSVSGGLVLFAVWWPWGDGVKTSLRVGLFVSDAGDTKRKQIKDRLFEWFHIR